MKKISLLCTFMCVTIASLYCQNFIINPFVGYRQTTLGAQNYTTASSVPMGIRVFAGFKRLQVGLEYSQSSPSYDFKDIIATRFSEKHVERYTGLLLRLGGPSFYLRGGFGLSTNVTKSIILPDNSVYESTKLSNASTLNAGLGFSFRVSDRIRIPIEGDYTFGARNAVDYAVKSTSKDETFAFSAWGIQTGLLIFW